jgi:4-diphosphocytidyl-2-C-methyl-D-erythritol kinase
MSALPLHALAPAKINLGLRLGQRREDGRHELVTVMQSISLADELALEWAQARESAEAPRGNGRDEVVCAGVDGPPEQNLASLALAAFRVATAWEAPPLRLAISKRVPVAAGLGGGSGDAAATLRLAASASARGSELLLALAAKLGADVPAQVRPGRWLATGAGELLDELPPTKSAFAVLVLPIDASLATAAVYAEADRLGLARTTGELDSYRRALSAALETGAALPPAALLVNDLEPAARTLCPAIDEGVARVRASGADAALMSGSGPTVLGLFAGEEPLARAQHATRELAAALSAPALAPVAAVPVQAPFGEPGVLLSQFRGSA